jgi:hypothetical protein
MLPLEWQDKQCESDIIMKGKRKHSLEHFPSNQRVSGVKERKDERKHLKDCFPSGQTLDSETCEMDHPRRKHSRGCMRYLNS